jgi:hypothetical protein
LDTTTVLLLDVDPQSLHFEDDAVVFSSHLPQSRRVATPECLHSYLLPLLWPGFYTTPRDYNEIIRPGGSVALTVNRRVR